MFRIFVVLGTVFMILLIIIYWDEVGASHLYLHTPVSPGPRMSPPPPVPPRAQTSRAPSFLSDIDAFVNQFLEPGTGEPTDQVPVDTSNQSEKAEERYIPRREWKIHLSPVAAELRDRQVRVWSPNHVCELQQQNLYSRRARAQPSPHPSLMV